MRQLSPGSPPSDDFDLAGSLSPEVKYVHVATLQCFVYEQDRR